MIWQSSEEMIEAPVKPTVQNKPSVQACRGYSVRIFWCQKGFEIKSSAPVKPTVIGALLGAKTSSEDGNWSLMASRQAECDWLNQRWRSI
jgi:hypothetical protein